MPTPPVTDEALIEVLEVYERNNNSRMATVRETGKSDATIGRYLRVARERGLHLSKGAREAMQATDLSGMEIAGGYRHVYDDEGKKTETVRWNAPKPDATEDVLERIRFAFEGISAATLSEPPASVNSEICTVYPIADAHIGLMENGPRDRHLAPRTCGLLHSLSSVLRATFNRR